MDLIKSILQEKEQRLSSKKYMLNDYKFCRRISGPLSYTTTDQQGRDYQGNFVYPEDATEIKSHPFFRDVPWERLHLMKPPFVPKVKSWEDTKYFEEEEPVSDVEDSASYSGALEDGIRGLCKGAVARALKKEVKVSHSWECNARLKQLTMSSRRGGRISKQVA